MRILLTASLLLLTACAPDAEAPVDAEITPAGTDDAARRSADETSLADPTREGPTRTRDASSGEAIPARFIGAWDYVEGTCAAASDARMEIARDVFTFYESVGEVTDVEVENPNTVVVTLAMSGEGENWEQRTRFTLTTGANRLIAVDADGNQPGTPLPLKRCET